MGVITNAPGLTRERLTTVRRQTKPPVSDIYSPHAAESNRITSVHTHDVPAVEATIDNSCCGCDTNDTGAVT